MRRLRIDWEGSARLEGGSWQQHCGRSYALLDAGSAVLLGVEEPDEGEAVAPILAGDLSRVAFPELVSLIAHGRISGVLRVYTSSAARSVVFESGEVCGASSQRVGERLGEILVRLGLVKRESVETLEREAGTARGMGRLAVERGLISERGLWTATQELVTTVFQGILQETRGSFALTEETDGSTLSVPGLSAEGLLMEGVRRLDELRSLRSGEAHHSEPAQVLEAFNTAFRDIFATAEQAGAGSLLRRAADSIFEDDPAHADFRGVSFTPEGELLSAEVLPRLEEGWDSGLGPGERLADALSTAMLFLLFVAGEHMARDEHQALHSRVKARVERD